MPGLRNIFSDVLEPTQDTVSDMRGIFADILKEPTAPELPKQPKTRLTDIPLPKGGTLPLPTYEDVIPKQKDRDPLLPARG